MDGGREGGRAGTTCAVLSDHHWKTSPSGTRKATGSTAQVGLCNGLGDPALARQQRPTCIRKVSASPTSVGSEGSPVAHEHAGADRRGGREGDVHQVEPHPEPARHRPEGHLAAQVGVECLFPGTRQSKLGRARDCDAQVGSPSRNRHGRRGTSAAGAAPAAAPGGAAAEVLS